MSTTRAAPKSRTKRAPTDAQGVATDRGSASANPPRRVPVPIDEERRAAPAAAAKARRGGKVVESPANGKRAKGQRQTKAMTKSKTTSKTNSKNGAEAGRAQGTRQKSAAKASAKPKLTARTADVHDLYQRSVQTPETDVAFLTRVFKKVRGRAPLHVREDFCGTAYFLSAWLRARPEHTGEGFDIDPDPVEWGLAHNFEGVVDRERRAEIHLADVRDPSTRPPDIRFAPNFSWMIFTERPVLLDYLRRAHRDLAEGGMFFLDIYGGSEAVEEMEDARPVEGGFTYVWDQVSYHPATGGYHCRIHFRFKDGSELRSAYDYRWRLWTLPELVDLLTEAGFQTVESYWEGTDPNGVDGNGIFRRSARGENCPAWVTYVVAHK
jgi:hypothetical protein